MDAKHFKTKRVMERFKYMHDFAQMLCRVMIDWCVEKGISPVVTETVSTLEEDMALHRKSHTHREGRAFDIRTRDWEPEHIDEFIEVFTKLYGKYGAVSVKTRKPTLIVYHDAGTGPHFHVQLNRSYIVNIPKNLKQTS